MPAPIDRLLRCTAQAHNITQFAMRTSTRRKDVVAARWAFAEWARSEGYSLPVIGRAINKHHTTILHALRQVGDA